MSHLRNVQWNTSSRLPIFSRQHDERGEQMEIVEKLTSHHAMVIDLTVNLGAYLTLSVLALAVHLRFR